jgi:diaminohydroxyphosphoribosylaminopyrimidine deaminase / 5-amino-6-(5-phosphoribosylamino)uracil reductase
MVGAIVVRDGKIVGEGYHQQFGGPHAEVFALEQAGDLARGATLYVTLEPCSHFGKTPPCVDAILKAGISKVVAAMEDPFPEVSGSGIEKLQAAGVEVVVGIEEAAARNLNAPFVKLVTRLTPYVIAKWAMSLDGKIATRTGDSKWISNEASRAKVHELRGRVDAIVVGIGTVLADDPLLTARPPGPRTACRVVFDRSLRLPLDSKLVKTTKEAPLLVVHQSNDSHKIKPLTDAGCELLSTAGATPQEMVSTLLKAAGQRRWANILVEGGASLLGSFFDADAIDETLVFLASKIIGGDESTTPIGGMGAELVQQSKQFHLEECTTISGDLFLRSTRLP